MRRSNQINPMRMLVMLAVLWVAGTLLFAAESTPPAAKPRPAAATTVPAQAAAAEPATQNPAAGDPTADGKDAPPKAETPGEEAVSAEEAAATPEKSKTEDGDAKQASSADKGGTPQRFVPSEQVRADFDVSFPIDI